MTVNYILHKKIGVLTMNSNSKDGLETWTIGIFSIANYENKKEFNILISSYHNNMRILVEALWRPYHRLFQPMRPK